MSIFCGIALIRRQQLFFELDTYFFSLSTKNVVGNVYKVAEGNNYIK